MFESFGSIAIRPICSEALRPTFFQVLPPSSERYTPLPYETLRWLLFSPVPTQTVSGFFGSSTMAPIEYEPSRSKTDVHVFPLLMVRHTPPEAEATKYFAALLGSTAKPITRPEVKAGPTERNLRPLKVGDDIGSRGPRASSSAGVCTPRAVSAAGDACGAGVAIGVGVACGLFSGCAKTSAGNAIRKTIANNLQGKVLTVQGRISWTPQLIFFVTADDVRSNNKRKVRERVNRLKQRRIRVRTSTGERFQSKHRRRALAHRRGRRRQKPPRDESRTRHLYRKCRGRRGSRR